MTLRRPDGRSSAAFVGALACAVVASLGAPARGLLAQDVLGFQRGWAWADYPPTEDFAAALVREFAEAGGALWARTNASLHVYDGFQWNGITDQDGLPAGRVSSLAEAPDGGVLVVVDGRLYTGGSDGFRPAAVNDQLDGGMVVVRAVPAFDGDILMLGQRSPEDATLAVHLARGTEIRDITPDIGLGYSESLWGRPGAAAWVSSLDGLLRWDGDEWGVALPRTRAWARVTTFDMTTVDRPVALMGDAVSGWLVARIDPDGADVIPLEGVEQPRSVTSTSDGLLVLAYEDGGVRIWDGSTWAPVELPLTRQGAIQVVYRATGDDLWFTTNAGVRLFRRNDHRWTSIEFDRSDPRNRINEILVGGDRTVWLGTHEGIVELVDDEPRTWLRDIDGEPIGAVTGLTLDSEGGLWVAGGATLMGTARFLNGRWTRYGPEQGFEAGRVHSIHTSSDGTIWLAALGTGQDDEWGGGIFRLQDDRFTRVSDPDSLLVGRSYSFSEGSDGTLWFGSIRGLARLRDGAWTTWDRTSGIIDPELALKPEARVLSIATDDTGGAWFTYGSYNYHGLAYIDATDRIQHFGANDGLPSTLIQEVALGPFGEIWLSSETGLARGTRQGWTLFDGSTGLDPAGGWPLAFRDSSLLLGTTRGVRILDLTPARGPAPRVALDAVYVETPLVQAAWSAYAPRGSIPAERIETRYRIDDRDWSSWSTSRSFVSTADQSELDPGEHSIQVQARGLFGQLSTPAEATFTLPLPVFLRPVFYGPVGAMALALGLLGYQLRARQREEERVLRRNEERFRSLVDTAPDAIAIYDLDAERFVLANQAASDITGLDPASPESATLASVGMSSLAAPELDGSPGALARAFEGEPVTLVRFLHLDGEQVPVEIRLVRYPGDETRRVRLSILDITERIEQEERRQELEAQLRQAQRMEAVGQLTGGVAHDFNNLLTVIGGNLELLQQRGDEDGVRGELVADALDATRRSAELTSRLLSFSRQQALSPRAVDVGILLNDLMALVGRTLGETIEVRTSVAERCPAAFVDPGQLESALLNLAVNARDAMSGDGVVTITVDTVTLDRPHLDGHAEMAAGTYVRIRTTDTGSGMPPEVIAHAFEPFFTTKEVGKGSGLGLSMIYGFARQSEGLVRIESEMGRGTTVEMLLPAAAPDTDPEVPVLTLTDVQRGSGESILIVEDDPAVLDFERGLCERLGYTTVGTTSGASALAVLQGDTPVDLLLSDVVLPGGMTGVDIATRARALHPTLPILLCSGYAEAPLMDRAKELPGVDVIAKPFSAVTLSHRLRALLDAR